MMYHAMIVTQQFSAALQKLDELWKGESRAPLIVKYKENLNLVLILSQLTDSEI